MQCQLGYRDAKRRATQTYTPSRHALTQELQLATRGSQERQMLTPAAFLACAFENRGSQEPQMLTPAPFSACAFEN